MEAPKKIYIDHHPFRDEYEEHWYSAPAGDKSVEYVRTDVFIDNACANLKKLMYDNLMFQGSLHREEVINNFVEDFKKHLKGE